MGQSDGHLAVTRSPWERRMRSPAAACRRRSSLGIALALFRRNAYHLYRQTIPPALSEGWHLGRECQTRFHGKKRADQTKRCSTHLRATAPVCVRLASSGRISRARSDAMRALPSSVKWNESKKSVGPGGMRLAASTSGRPKRRASSPRYIRGVHRGKLRSRLDSVRNRSD